MALLFRLPFLLLELLLRRLLGRDDDDDRVNVVTPEAARAAATPAPVPPPPGPRTPGPTAPRPRTPGPGAPRPAPSAGGAFAGTAGPPPTAEEALGRRAAREATAAPASATPLRPIGDAGHVDRDAAVVESFGPADDVNGTVTVDPPWPGYDEDTAAVIVGRLRDADTATKAVVALYERGRKGRATVLRAAR